MSMERSLKALAQIPFLSDLEDEHRKLLAFGGEVRVFNHGDTIFMAENPSDGGLVILSGTVALHLQGKVDAVPDELIGSGSLIGQRALFSQTKHVSTAIAKGSVEVLILRRALFKRMITEYPDLAEKLYQNMRDDLARFSEAMGNASMAIQRDLPADLTVDDIEKAIQA